MHTHNLRRMFGIVVCKISFILWFRTILSVTDAARFGETETERVFQHIDIKFCLKFSKIIFIPMAQIVSLCESAFLSISTECAYSVYSFCNDIDIVAHSHTFSCIAIVDAALTIAQRSHVFAFFYFVEHLIANQHSWKFHR